MRKLKWFCNWYTLIIIGILVGFYSFHSEHLFTNSVVISIYSMIVTILISVVLGIAGFFYSKDKINVKDFLKNYGTYIIYGSLASLISVIVCSLIMK